MGISVGAYRELKEHNEALRALCASVADELRALYSRSFPDLSEAVTERIQEIEDRLRA